ncbi:GH3 auxin-responsive promoter family protein [Methanobrevibacter arboriphilus]|uniref:GH3 auxin-responsive promoter family protein n=1 Tax=Methanobrevibacter arboriphilus TaxID=39441 RepID=UPI000AFA681B|nr:GH3 auxin-responsive promoter family protein [Methanobrevibacter arboriphilus]
MIRLKKRILGKIELDYLQEETHLLYRDLMIMKGISSAQLKPPRVIVNEVQRKFFFALTE